LCVPLEHLLVLALRVGNTIVTPSEDRRRSWSESLELAFSWLLVFEVDRELFEVQRLCGLLLPAVDEMHEVPSRILQCENLSSGWAFQVTDRTGVEDMVAMMCCTEDELEFYSTLQAYRLFLHT
jgi:hypothetical protein